MLEEMLHDPNHSRRKLLFGAREDWTDELLRGAYETTVALIGHVFMPVVPFDRWPWRLFKLVDDDVAEEEKVDLEDAVDELCDECTPLGDGFTIPFRRQVARKADTRSEQNCSCLQDVRGRSKATTVLTEDPFSRVRHALPWLPTTAWRSSKRCTKSLWTSASLDLVDSFYNRCSPISFLSCSACTVCVTHLCPNTDYNY